MDQILNGKKKTNERKKRAKRKHICVFVCVERAVASRSAAHAHARSNCTTTTTVVAVVVVVVVSY